MTEDNDEMINVVKRLDNLSKKDKVKIAIWLGDLSGRRKSERKNDLENGFGELEEQCDE